MCFGWWSNGGPSVGLVEGFHCGFNLRRQPADRAGPHTEPLCLRLSLAVSPPTGHLAAIMNLFCFSLVRALLSASTESEDANVSVATLNQSMLSKEWDDVGL